jgi:hypothetical protein
MLEVLKQALEALEELNETQSYWWQEVDEATLAKINSTITAIKEAIREHAIYEVQRLGQEIEQEPIANLEIVDLGDGNKHFDNHWLSDLHSLPCGDYLLYTHPPQRTEHPAWFPAVENILNEYGLQAIDFVADFKAAMKDAEQPQRTWVGLTDDEIIKMLEMKEDGTYPYGFDVVKEADAKLKEKNCL